MPRRDTARHSPACSLRSARRGSRGPPYAGYAGRGGPDGSARWVGSGFAKHGLRRESWHPRNAAPNVASRRGKAPNLDAEGCAAKPGKGDHQHQIHLARAIATSAHFDQ